MMWTSGALQHLMLEMQPSRQQEELQQCSGEKSLDAQLDVMQVHYSQVTGKRNGKGAQERTQLTSEVSEASLSAIPLLSAEWHLV